MAKALDQVKDFIDGLGSDVSMRAVQTCVEQYLRYVQAGAEVIEGVGQIIAGDLRGLEDVGAGVGELVEIGLEELKNRLDDAPWVAEMYGHAQNGTFLASAAQPGVWWKATHGGSCTVKRPVTRKRDQRLFAEFVGATLSSPGMLERNPGLDKAALRTWLRLLRTQGMDGFGPVKDELLRGFGGGIEGVKESTVSGLTGEPVFSSDALSALPVARRLRKQLGAELEEKRPEGQKTKPTPEKKKKAIGLAAGTTAAMYFFTR